MRCAFVFGQFGAAADPVSLPSLRDRAAQAGIETVLIQHTDTQQAYNFLHGYDGPVALIGASLGAGIVPIIAGYLRLQKVDYIAGFQPSSWDPVMHYDAATGFETVNVPANVVYAHCYRNPVWAATGGLGFAIWALAPGNGHTRLIVTPRNDPHPGDFGIAADTVFNELVERK